ncbi:MULTISPECIES: SRPBCC family protein [Streptomyces]|uniref:SRPBCC family protein n=1 Tax=Streptomyces morookaense TaxID=1970 RepID=A0A7Y7E6B7_STRMO|nr:MULTISPECIES: SRPBCC family protein [Streptomyces]MCC2276028.1 SRPBCC family protein [Streptomyces sp. ET3-23]NVK77748.1 SRPBCC family protein [Streptomyces morookaense]GHF04765.1 hypothetical protein GCM10010359_02160 [Streptomyces morookaense]
MTEYERSRTMPALPELVFDEAADTARLEAWMPRDLHVQVGEPPAVTVHEDRTDSDERGLLRSQKDQMRMEWGTRDDGRYAGWLQVAGMESAGTSRVTIHLSFFDEDSAPPREVIEQGLDESLARLEEQVRLRAESSG